MQAGESLKSLGHRVLKEQPFSALLGAELLDLTVGRARLEVAIKPEHLQQFGFVHGGVLSYAMDNALTFAGGSVLGPSVVTAEFKVNYLCPASGAFIIANAVCVHHGKRQAVCTCTLHVRDHEGVERLCAVAQGTVVVAGSAIAPKDVDF